MSQPEIIIIGGPDSGKTNYLARLSVAIDMSGSALSSTKTPEDIKYVEDALVHLHEGRFAPRTNKNFKGSLTVTLPSPDQQTKVTADLVIPDMSGEVWKDAVKTNELAPEWMAALQNSVGALLFVRILSELNTDPLDWVTSAKLMRLHGAGGTEHDLPTQVMLCEFIRLLEIKLAAHRDLERPRLAVVVTAWDLLDPQLADAGPSAYLAREYPLFAGRLDDLDNFDIAVFGTSIIGGDPSKDSKFRRRFFRSDFNSLGYVVIEHGGVPKKRSDLTLPVAWAIGMAPSFS